MITVTILQVELIAGDDVIPASHRADLLLNQDDTTFYLWSRGGLAPELTEAQIQAVVDGEAERLFAFAAASGRAVPDDREWQRTVTTAAFRNQVKALRALSPTDAGYALMARIMAFNDGASGAVINGIVDRSTAAAYLTGKPEWVNLPASAKAWLADELDMHAGVYQLLFYLLEW